MGSRLYFDQQAIDIAIANLVPEGALNPRF